MLFELSHENTGLEALHFHGKAKQFEVRLPFALSNEAEPNMRFLLIVGTKFNLRSCCCSNGVGQIFTGNVFTVGKGWQSPKVCWALVPRRVKKMEATVGQKNGRTDENVASLEQNKNH